MWFEKKKCQFPRFLSFRFCPILEIENLKTSESLRLRQILNASVARLKPFTESQINVACQINKDTVQKKTPIYVCFFLNDANGFLRSFSKKTGALVQIHLTTNYLFSYDIYNKCTFFEHFRIMKKKFLKNEKMAN